MSNRTIVVLAVVASGCLVLGAQLLDHPSAVMAVIAGLILVLGTACAAAAVAGAWRPAPDRSARSTRPDPTPDRRSRQATRSGA